MFSENPHFDLIKLKKIPGQTPIQKSTFSKLCSTANFAVTLYFYGRFRQSFPRGARSPKIVRYAKMAPKPKEVSVELLEERIRRDGVVKAGGVLKVDAFLNHQMDIELFSQMAEEWKRLFRGQAH